MIEERKKLHIGLCKARHDIMTNDGEEVTDFFFEKIENPHDYTHMEKLAYEKFLEMLRSDDGYNVTIYLYVTGLTMALTSVLKAHVSRTYIYRFDVVLMHYDRESNSYKEQVWE